MRRRIGMYALALHRHDPSQILNNAVANEEPLVRARALRAVGQLDRADPLHPCQANCAAEDADCRCWAAWSGRRLGDVREVSVLREIATSGDAMAEQACDVAARLVNTDEALDWQKQISKREGHERLAIIAAGVIGDPILVPWLPETMRIDNVARLADAVLSCITGVDIADNNL